MSASTTPPGSLSHAFEPTLGTPFPQGATWDGKGTNFSLFAEGADAVELCLFAGAHPHEEVARVPLKTCQAGVWFGYLSGVKPGQAYGYRVHGPYKPENGQRFNPDKLLLDPYAKGLTRTLIWDDSVFGYTLAAC